jgi:hypothetical protein
MKQTRVIFIYEGSTRDVLAVFPDSKKGNWFDCFAFIGGHSVCSVDYLTMSEVAKVGDILPVYNFLTSQGYNLKRLTKKVF